MPSSAASHSVNPFYFCPPAAAPPLKKNRASGRPRLPPSHTLLLFPPPQRFWRLRVYHTTAVCTAPAVTDDPPRPLPSRSPAAAATTVTAAAASAAAAVVPPVPVAQCPAAWPRHCRATSRGGVGLCAPYPLFAPPWAMPPATGRLPHPAGRECGRRRDGHPHWKKQDWGGSVARRAREGTGHPGESPPLLRMRLSFEIQTGGPTPTRRWGRRATIVPATHAALPTPLSVRRRPRGTPPTAPRARPASPAPLPLRPQRSPPITGQPVGQSHQSRSAVACSLCARPGRPHLVWSSATCATASPHLVRMSPPL